MIKIKNFVVNKLVSRTGKLFLMSLLIVNMMYFAFNRVTENRIPAFVISQEPSFNYPRRLKSFEKSVEVLFKEVEKNPDQYWVSNTALTEVQIDVPIRPFLAKYENDDSWASKKELYYDPRFTLSMYLNELRTQYLRTKDAGSRVVDANLYLNTPILPFNWADWMDLTSLNKELVKPIDERISCEWLMENTNNQPDPYFCIENNDFPESELKALGFKYKEQLPGAIINAHARHEDRSVNNLRVFQAKAHALTHLPKPYRVIILNGDKKGGTYEFDVDLNSNQRLASSQMIDNYLVSNNINIEEVDEDFVIKLNHIDELNKLKEAVTPLHLQPEDKGYKMYHTLKKQSNPRASREFHLEAKSFNFESIELQAEALINKPELSHLEKLYLSGLIECAQYNDTSEPVYFGMPVIDNQDPDNLDHEWGWHYDWRFFNGALNYHREGWTQQDKNIRTNIILERLLRTWNTFAEEKGIISWIMHGPLLSWYWNGLMFPFDVDIDIQMPMADLVRLARDFNQTLVVENPEDGYGRFLIDVGSYMHHRGISGHNHIDARFVDVDSGIYIDITGLSKSDANLPEEYSKKEKFELTEISKQDGDDKAEIYNDRRKHFYKLDQLSPLRYSMMGGVPVYIPSTITNRLKFEYSKGLSRYEYGGWYFVSVLNLWIQETYIIDTFSKTNFYKEDDIEKVDKEKVTNFVQNMTEEDALSLLEVTDVLVEYYLTKKHTDTHTLESIFLFDRTGNDTNFLAQTPHFKEIYNELTSTFKIAPKPLRKCLYDFENIEKPRRQARILN